MRLGAIVLAVIWLCPAISLAQTPPPSQSDDDGHRIVGGVPAPALAAPWQAEIQLATVTRAPAWRWAHHCGGALIAPGWVLTAAHCVSDFEPSGLRVMLGTQDLEVAGYVNLVDSVVVHQDYRQRGGPNDIALLHIVPNPAASKPDHAITPVPIAIADGSAGRKVKENDDVIVRGWGRTVAQPQADQSGTNPPAVVAVLQQVGQRILAIETCQAAFPDRIDQGMVCAAGNPGQDSCTGDSGGPLTREPPRTSAYQGRPNLLVGIVSWGDDRCGSKPGVYTKVEFFQDWIKTTMGADAGRLVR